MQYDDGLNSLSPSLESLLTLYLWLVALIFAHFPRLTFGDFATD